MFAKRGIWVKGQWALSFGPHTPDGTSRFLRLSECFLSFSLSHSCLLPTTPLHSLTHLALSLYVSPTPALLLPDNLPIFSSHPQAPGSQDVAPPHHPRSAEILLLCWRCEIPVQRTIQAGKSRHWEMVLNSQSNTYSHIGEAHCYQWHYYPLITAFCRIFHIFFF